MPRLEVDYGLLAEGLEPLNESYEVSLCATPRLKRDPRDAHAHERRANLLWSLGRLPEAMEGLTNAIRLRPGDAHRWGLRGRLHLALRQYEPAVDDLEAARRLNPDARLTSVLLAEACTGRAWRWPPGPRQGATSSERLQWPAGRSN